MLKCALDKEQLIFIVKSVSSDLKKIDPKTFNIKDYATQWYNKINSAVKDQEQKHAKALDVTRAVLYYIPVVESKSREVAANLLDTDIDFKELKKLIFDITEEKTGLQKLENYLSVKSTLAEDIEALNTATPVIEKKSKAKPKSDVVSDSKPPVLGVIPQTRPSDLPAKQFAEISVPTALSTNVREDFKDAEDFPHKIQRKLIRDLIKNNYDGDKLSINGIPVVLSFKINPEGTDVIMKLTDSEGYEFQFDEQTLEPVDEGGISPSFPIDIPEINAKGEIIKTPTNAKAIDNTISFIAKNSFKGNTKLAYDNYKAQVQLLTDIKNHILKNPEAFVPVKINGGTLGYALVALKNSVKLNSLQGLPNIIDFNIAKTADPAKGIEEGWTYFYVDGFYEQPVILERPTIDEIPGLVDKLTSLMVDDIIDSTTGKPMLPSKRQSLIDTFIYTNKEGFQIVVKEDLINYDLKYFNEKISLDDKVKAREFIKNLLTGVKERRIKESKSDLTENQKKNIVTEKPTDPKPNMVLEEKVGDKTIYKIYEKLRLSIKDNNLDGDKLLNNVLPDVNLVERDGVIYAEPKDDTMYSTYLKDHGTVNYSLVNNQLRKYGSYFTFQPTSDTYKALNGGEAPVVSEVKPDKKIDTPASTDAGPSVGKFQKIDSKTIQDNIDKDKNTPKTWNKVFDQKRVDVKATLDQIEDARKWYENHPMRNLIPFEVMFHAVNTANKDSVATITRTGITLYKGSDYADLYHEAWHGFTQYFLTQEEKKKLYKEVSKKSGSFIDFQGRRVTFNSATPEQLEEYLAEEFRGYMLKGQKTTQDAPVKNSIFRKIYDILKALFGNTTVREINRDVSSNKVINDMFEKLRVGNINTQSFTQENVMFDELNRIKPFGEQAKTAEPLSSQDTMLLMESVNSIFTEYSNLLNQGFGNFEDYRRLSNLRDKERTATTLKEKAEYRDQIKALTEGLSNDYSNSTTRFANPDNMKRSYEIVYNEFVDRYNALVKEWEDGGKTDDDLLKSINLLDYALDNFGDIETLSNNISKDVDSVKGVIGYHMYLNKEFYSEEDILDYENMSEDDLNIKGETYDKDRAAKDLAKKELVWLIGSLPAYDKDGNPEYNKLGFKKTARANQIWNRLFRTAEDILDPAALYSALKEEAKIYPAFNDLLNLLGPLDAMNIQVSNTWTNLWQVLSAPRVTLTQMGVDITKKDDVEVIETKIGEAFSSDRKSETKWNTELALRPEDKFTTKDSLGNKLNLQNIIKAFQYKSDNPNERLAGREVEFFRALGWNIMDTEEFRPGGAHYKELNGHATYLRSKLINLYQRGTVSVRTINDINKFYPTVLNAENQEILEFGETESRFKRIQTLNSRYSDEDYSFMSTTADGNAQSEHPLNSSLTVQIHALNNAKDYKELINTPGMEHLNVQTNPRAAALTMLKSLFQLDISPSSPEYGRRRIINGKPVQINLTNLSGIIVKDANDFRDGQASAKADATSKLIQEFYLTNQMMLPELMRASDKSTSLSATLTNVIGQEDKFFIGIEKFLPFKENYEQDRFEYLLPHLDAEFQRIKLFKSLDKTTIKNFDFNYYDRGLTFNEFDDILDESKKLIDKALNDKNETRTLSQIVNDNPEFKQTLKQDFKKYFDVQVAETAAALEDYNFISQNLYKQLKDSLVNKNEKQQLTNDIAKDALVKAFVHNSFINNLETIGMFYGDLALYNYLKEEFHKRNAGLISSGSLFRTDAAMRNLINKLGRTYSDKYSPENKYESYDGTFKTAIVKDAQIKSVYHSEYVDAFTKHFQEVEKLSLTEAKNKALSILKPYLEMNEGDGQGWIGFDSYRILKIAEGAWTSQQDAMYNKIVEEGVDVSLEEFTQFFPPYKPQYFGNLNTDNVDPRLKHLPLIAFHKFSLVPLVPGIAQGKNLQKLHEKMMTEGIDYVVFESGSKVSTITKNGQADDFYKDINDRAELSDEPFTVNKIYLKYFKNQVEIAPKWKGKSIFSTQLRKLIEDGTIMNGVPNDYEATMDSTKRMLKWNNLTEPAKKKASPIYTMLKAYEDDIRLLTELKKDELLKEMGWTLKEVNGKLVPQGSIKDLINFAINELDRQDLPRHAIDFLSVNKDGSLKRDLSYSLYADKIETVLTSLVVNRLVKQKVVGENLVQFSGALAENTSMIQKFEKPTEEQLKEYGSNQLPTYRQLYDKKGKALPTTAMKVKIAMQGKFKYLLEMEHPDGGKIETINRLNELLKDDKWLDTDNNRKLVTMVGVRIPVQGLNSMEFMEIYEFLPENAGNIIIPPAEIVAKSGSDFDIDKLSIYMPNISKTKDGILYKTDDSIEGVQNRIVNNIANILSLPENFVSLVRPNDTAIVQELADRMSEYVLDYDPRKVINGETRRNSKGKAVISPTRALEINYNIYKHSSNNIGKQTLGLGAVDNTYNAIFNRIGFYLNPTNGISDAEYLKLKQDFDSGKFDKNSVKKANIAKSLKNHVSQRLFLSHNTLDLASGKAISLSHAYDANDEYRISDIINQLMNGWVDIAKDAWIFNLQGNKEVSPVLLFMIQAGVPLEEAVYFASMPLVREYVKEQQLRKAALAKVFGTAPENPMYFRNDARAEILNKIGLQKGKGSWDGWLSNTMNTKSSDYFKDEKKTFDKDTLLSRIKDYKKQGADYEYNDTDTLAFLHFLEIEEMSKVVRDIKMTVNFDTDKTGSLFAAQDKQLAIQKLKANNKFSTHFVNKVIEESPIGSFNVQDFQLDVFQDLFPFKASKLLNKQLFDIIRDKSDAIDAIFSDTEMFANAYKSDFLNYIYQNELRDFDPNAKSYKGFPIEKDKVRYLARGASLEITKDDFGFTLYVDKRTLENIYKEEEGQKWNDYFTNNGLHKISKSAFKTSKSFIEFVLERETLRKTLTPAKAANHPLYKYIEQTLKAPAKLKDEAAEDYITRTKQGVYEKFLATTALTNIYNHWQLFDSDLSYATQYEILKQAYGKELTDDFSVLNNIVADEKNLKLTIPRVDKEMADTMYENLEVLSNRNKIKIDREATDILADFFSKIPHVAFLQSGYNTKGMFSLTPYVNPEPVYAILERAAKKYAKHMDTVYKSMADDSKRTLSASLLDDYTTAFFKENADRKRRIRGKDYYTGNTVDNSIKDDMSRKYTMRKVDKKRASYIDYNSHMKASWKSVDKLIKGQHLARALKNNTVEIVLNEITVDNFFDYLIDKSAQKKATLPILLEKYNITLDNIRNIVQTKEMAVAFILYHEESHVINRDLFNPEIMAILKQHDDGKITYEEMLLHPTMVEMEARANYDAFDKLYNIVSKNFEELPVVPDKSIKIKQHPNPSVNYGIFSGTQLPNNMDINKFMEDNPDYIVVINGTVSGKTGGTTDDIQLSNVKDEYKDRVVILPTSLSTNPGGGTDFYLDQSKLSEDQIESINTEIDSKIEYIKEKAKTDNLKIAFNKDGYGGYMVESTEILFPKSKQVARRMSPDIFKNLSIKLFDNFNYINPNFIADYSRTGREYVQKLQPVSDAQVREFLKNLINCK